MPTRAAKRADEYSSVQLDIPTRDLADVDELVKAAQHPAMDRKAMLHVVIVTGVTYWKSQEKKPRKGGRSMIWIHAAGIALCWGRSGGARSLNPAPGAAADAHAEGHPRESDTWRS